MGMPRKGSRKIEVDGEQFLWRTRRVESKAYPLVLLLTCQRNEDRPGRVMQVELRPKRWTTTYDLTDGNFGNEQHKNLSNLTPDDVRDAIRFALKDGWNPSERGAAYKPKGKVDLPEFIDRR